MATPSNLVQLGATVLEWKAEYEELAGLLVSVADEFELATGESTFLPDYEYKKVAPGGGALPAGGLVVKQVREIPQADTTPSITPFLINEPTEYCTAQANYSNVFAIHRLKTLGTFQTGSFWMTEENLAEGFWTTVDIEQERECEVGIINGPLDGLPEASYAFEGNTATAGWRLPRLANPRSYELETNRLSLLVAPSQSPLLTLRDFGATLRVEYEEPVPMNTPRMDTTDEVTIGVCPAEGPGDLRKERVLEGPGGVVITTSFYWPASSHLGVGYTNPLGRWDETVIEGLTSDPIVLHGYFSQSYRPTRHNASEHFIFDPFLEPGVPQHLLEELRDQDSRLIYVYLTGSTGSSAEFLYYDHDGTCVLGEPIPTVSEWGLLTMTLLMLTAGMLVFVRKRAA